MAPQGDSVPLQNSTAPAQAAPPAPVVNVTVAQPTAAPVIPVATQPTVAQAQPATVPTSAQIQYAQPGECKYHWDD